MTGELHVKSVTTGPATTVTLTEKIKGRDVRRGDHIADPRGRDSRFLHIDAVVEAPQMNGRTLWFEEQGRGEHIAVGLDEPLTRVAG